MKRSHRPMSLAITALLLAVGLAQAAPVSAGGFQPDGWVRYKSFKDQYRTYIDPGPWSGDDVYNRTGRNQKVVLKTVGSYAPDAHFVFQVRVENDGVADRFKVRASGTGDWVVRYLHGTTDITAAVEAGTYTTPNIASGGSLNLKVKVWLGDIGTDVMRLVTLTSNGNPEKQDAVKVRVSYGECTC